MPGYVVAVELQVEAETEEDALAIAESAVSEGPACCAALVSCTEVDT